MDWKKLEGEDQMAEKLWNTVKALTGQKANKGNYFKPNMLQGTQ